MKSKVKAPLTPNQTPHLCPFCESPRDESRNEDKATYAVTYRCRTKLKVERWGTNYVGAWTMLCRPKDYQ